MRRVYHVTRTETFGSVRFGDSRKRCRRRLAQVGVEPLACDRTLPATVRSAWHLAPQVACGAAAAKQDSKASAARAMLRAAISKAGAKASAAGSTAWRRCRRQHGQHRQGQRRYCSERRDDRVHRAEPGRRERHPDVTSFDTVDCDPYTAMVGPWYPDPDNRGCGYNTRFGVEDESEEWCADFAEFVWLHAGVTQDMDLINPGANSFYNWGLAQGESLTVDGTDPQVGDAVVQRRQGLRHRRIHGKPRPPSGQ